MVLTSILLHGRGSLVLLLSQTRKAILIHLPWTKRTVPTTAATTKAATATIMPVFFWGTVSYFNTWRQNRDREEKNQTRIILSLKHTDFMIRILISTFFKIQVVSYQSNFGTQHRLIQVDALLTNNIAVNLLPRWVSDRDSETTGLILFPVTLCQLSCITSVPKGTEFPSHQNTLKMSRYRMTYMFGCRRQDYFSVELHC